MPSKDPSSSDVEADQPAETKARSLLGNWALGLRRSGTASTARSGLRDCLDALLVAMILALFVRTFLLQVLEIPGDSMEPGLLAGDRLVVDRTTFAPHGAWAPFVPGREIERGDLVLFRFPEDLSRSFVKRCLGLPGDEVLISDKTLYVNGQPIDESGYVVHRDPRTYLDSQFLDEEFRQRDHMATRAVPTGQLFCLGDNRDLSNDSRYWGMVPREAVIGRPILVLWSFERGLALEEEFSDSAWGKIERSWRRLEQGIRWNRSLTAVR